MSKNSLWADVDDDIKLDQEEFNELFVESSDIQKKNILQKSSLENTSSAPSAGAGPAGGPKANNKIKINLIDAKRGQNAGISLARIKLTFAEVRDRISLMSDEMFSTDQLRSLLEYLPTIEESSLIAAYKGDLDRLGTAEKYMKVMEGFESAAKHIEVMIYKQQFHSRLSECEKTLIVIGNACDDVKGCLGLKKIMKTILKVGNQMNDGEDHMGFTLDSLLKLQSAKAFDKKTSILLYVIRLIHRNEKSYLLFPDELSSCAEASRLTLDSANQEEVALKRGLDASLKVIAANQLENHERIATPSAVIMANFLIGARAGLEALNFKIKQVRDKFSDVLIYFGEEASMPCQDFFYTLTSFVQEFKGVRDNFERTHRSDQLKVEREKDRKDKELLKGKV